MESSMQIRKVRAFNSPVPGRVGCALWRNVLGLWLLGFSWFGNMASAQPLTPGNAVSLNGSSGYIATSVSSSISSASPPPMTESAWFKTTVAGGRLLGFSSLQTGLSSGYDRNLYMDNSGRVWFGIYNGAINAIGTTNSTYNDGLWHQATATFSTNTGMQLYLDGALAASNPGVTNEVAISGYWRIGWDNLNSWSNAPSNYYFNGSLDEIQIWNSVLTANQVRANWHPLLTGTESGLLYYWHFDEGSGTTSADSTANGNLGTFEGGVTWINSTAPVGLAVVTNLPASAITTQSATLNGSVTPNFQMTGCYFRYGPTTGYGATTAATSLGSDPNNSPVSASQNVTAGLTPYQLYHYQLVATNSAGTNYSADLTFVPENIIAPSVTTEPAIDVTTNSALLTGSVTSGAIPCAVWFQYGPVGGYVSNTPPGLADGALYFNGSAANYVSIPNPSMNIPSGTSAYTIEAWIYPTAMGDEGIVGWGNWGTKDHVNSLRLDANGLRNDWWSDDLLAATNLVGAWHHVAVTFDGTTRVLYVDGGQVAADAPSATHADPVANVQIGLTGSTNSVVQPFKGYIDEVRLWGTNLTQAAITNWMHRGIASQHPAFPFLEAYWSMNGGWNTNLVDLSGNGSTGVFMGSPVWTNGVVLTNELVGAPVSGLNGGAQYSFTIMATNQAGTGVGSPQTFTIPSSATIASVTPQEGSATLSGQVNFPSATSAVYLQYGTTPSLGSVTAPLWITNQSAAIVGSQSALFNGTNGYVSISNEPNFRFTGPFSIEAWIKVAAFTNQWQAIVTKGDSSWRLQEDSSGNTLDFGTSGLQNADLFGTKPVNDGQWHHVAGVFDGTNTFLYVDGALDAFSIHTGLAGTVSGNTYPVFIGANAESSGRTWDGSIDEVRIWNTNLSAATIANWMNQPVTASHPDYANLVGYWNFDQVLSNDVPDLSGHSNDGTLVGGALLVSGVNPPIPFSQLLLGLSAGTTYYFDVVVSNAFGLSTNAVRQFTTLPGTAPMATTLPVSGNPPVHTFFNGSIQTYGLPALAYFQYGPDTSYGSLTASSNLLSGGVVSFSQAVRNLLPAATYHFQLVASNAFGATTGVDESFTTPLFPRASDFTDTNGNVISAGPLAWGDLNNDGLLDIVSLFGTGPFETGPSTLATNNGDGTFTAVPSPFPTFTFGSGAVAVGDFENQGRLDVILSGGEIAYNGFQYVEKPVAQLWRNLGNMNFVNLTNISLPQLSEGSIALADYDNDGHLDILMTGADTNGKPQTVLLRNLGNDSFAPVNTGLPGTAFGGVAWGDFDGDGRPDLLLTGASSNIPPFGIIVPISQVWRNLGGGVFTNMNVPLPALENSSVAWGDFDNDGKPDILLAGYDGTNWLVQVWRNLGNGSFSNINVNIPGISMTAEQDKVTAAWGDYDNDGYLDILLSGADTNEVATTQIWRNQRNRTFSNVFTGLPSLGGVAAWADFMNNGRLGLFISGVETNPTAHSSFFENLNATSNTPPSAPAGLNATVANFQVSLNWNPAADAQSPSAGLTYNLRIGTTSGGFDVLSAEADANTGFRLLPAFGNLGEATGDTNFSAALPGGVYYWSVQAVDNAFAGSPFAPESIFVIPDGAPAVTGLASAIGAATASFNAQVNPVAGDTYAYVQWGLTTAYGNKTADQSLGNGLAFQPIAFLLTSLTPGTLYHWRVIAFNDFGVTRSSDQTFTTALPPLFTRISPGVGQLQLQFTGTLGIDYTLQSSSNLLQWVDVTNLAAGSNGLFQFVVPEATNSSKEFFRLKSQ